MKEGLIVGLLNSKMYRQSQVQKKFNLERNADGIQEE